LFIKHKGSLSLEFLFVLLLLLIIVGFFITANSLLSEHFEKQKNQEEYLNQIKNIKENLLEKVNGVFFEKQKRTNFFV
jgi:CHASE3 domain sensor protein